MLINRCCGPASRDGGGFASAGHDVCRNVGRARRGDARIGYRNAHNAWAPGGRRISSLSAAKGGSVHAETGRQWSSQASPSGSSATDPRAAIEELVTAGFPERQANALVCSLGQLMKRGLSIAAVI